MALGELSNVDGVLHRPKGSTLNWYRPCDVVNAVFSLASSFKAHLPVTTSQIKCDKTSGSIQRVKSVIYSWERITVLHHYAFHLQ